MDLVDTKSKQLKDLSKLLKDLIKLTEGAKAS